MWGMKKKGEAARRPVKNAPENRRVGEVAENFPEKTDWAQSYRTTPPGGEQQDQSAACFSGVSKDGGIHSLAVLVRKMRWLMVPTQEEARDSRASQDRHQERNSAGISHRAPLRPWPRQGEPCRFACSPAEAGETGVPASQHGQDQATVCFSGRGTQRGSSPPGGASGLVPGLSIFLAVFGGPEAGEGRIGLRTGPAALVPLPAAFQATFQILASQYRGCGD